MSEVVRTAASRSTRRCGLGLRVLAEVDPEGEMLQFTLHSV